jgi:uncharacterized protein
VRSMKVFMVGGSGFIGKGLVGELERHGHRCTVLVRRPVAPPQGSGSVRYIRGNSSEPGPWQEEMLDHDVVINLAGTTIFQRWSRRVRADILDSRVMSTRRIVEAMAGSPGKDIQLFNASGVGYYGHCRDVLVDEYVPSGETFLARVASEWESEAQKAATLGKRVVLCRFGIVLGREGGALGRIAASVRLHLGAAWGTGRQWFSWIHEKDVARAFLFLLRERHIEGPVNLTAPEPVTNWQMAAAFGEVLRKRAYIKTLPGWIFEMVLGEFSHVFLEGQRVIPRRLLEHGFHFLFPTLKPTLENLLAP